MSVLKSFFWPILILLFVLFLQAIQAILLPFVIGMLIAYLLDPLADRLEARRIKRGLAAAIICIAFFGLIALATMLLAPVLVAQLKELIRLMPDYINQLQTFIETRAEWLNQWVDISSLSAPASVDSDASKQLAKALSSVVGRVFESGAAVLNLLSLLLITPIVCFYLLRDWDTIVTAIDDLLPQHYAPVIREQMSRIDQTISAFLHGMFQVMLLLSVFYSLALSLIGLDFAILIGVFSGFIIIIPYLGTLLSAAAALGMAYYQFDELQPMIIVGVIYGLAQFTEGYFLTPKLVGDKVGLHPVWLIFGMLAGGALFGFAGVLLAIPASAIIGVLLRFAVVEYKKSTYFKESSPAKVTPKL